MIACYGEVWVRVCMLWGGEGVIACHGEVWVRVCMLRGVGRCGEEASPRRLIGGGEVGCTSLCRTRGCGRVCPTAPACPWCALGPGSGPGGRRRVGPARRGLVCLDVRPTGQQTTFPGGPKAHLSHVIEGCDRVRQRLKMV